MAIMTDRVVPGDESGLRRISLTEFEIGRGESSEVLNYPIEEAVYFVTSGYATLMMRSSSADWEYPLQQNSAVWLSDSAHHQIRNDGAGPLNCVCFRFNVAESVQRAGKEVQRRIVELADAPLEMQRGIVQRFIFRGSAMPSNGIDTVESSLLAPGCGFPSHFNQTIEGIAYVTRGEGIAADQGVRKGVRAGSIITWRAGGERFIEAGREIYLQLVYCNVLV